MKLELESNKILNVLDVSIKREEDSTPTVEIYRKPTQTDLIIPNDSNHHNTQNSSTQNHDKQTPNKL